MSEKSNLLAAFMVPHPPLIVPAVGKGGENIKKIRIAAFKDIKKIFPSSKLELDLRVRVNGKWKSNDMILSKVFKETQS